MNVEDDKHRTTGNRAPRRALLAYLRYLSEENWAAGWLTDLEYILWDWVQRRRRHAEPTSAFGRASLSDIEALSWLSEQASGWWRWGEMSKQPVFVPLDEWLEIYQNRPTPTGPEDGEPAKSTKYLYGEKPAEVIPANGARGVLVRSADSTRAFRVYHDGRRFTDYEIRHDELSVTIDADELAAFYKVCPAKAGIGNVTSWTIVRRCWG